MKCICGNRTVQLLSFEYKENEKQLCKIDATSLQYKWTSNNIEIAEMVDLSMSKYSFGQEITMIRIHNNGAVMEFACRFYAGMTEDKDEFAIYLCAPEEEEKVGRTIRIMKNDNRVVVGEYYYLKY